MDQRQLAACFDEIYAAFPAVQQRMVTVPRYFAQWKQHLTPLAAALVSDGVTRWLRTHNYDPSLEQFLQCLDTLATERALQQGRAPVAFQQAAPLGSDRVPVEEVRVLLAQLFTKLETQERQLEQARGVRTGLVAGRRRVYRGGILGPLPIPLPAASHDDRNDERRGDDPRDPHDR